MGDHIEEALALANRVVSAVEPIEVTQAPHIAEQLARALLELSVRTDRFETARLRGENVALRYVVEMATRPAVDNSILERLDEIAESISERQWGDLVDPPIKDERPVRLPIGGALDNLRPDYA